MTVQLPHQLTQDISPLRRLVLVYLAHLINNMLTPSSQLRFQHLIPLWRYSVNLLDVPIKGDFPADFSCFGEVAEVIGYAVLDCGVCVEAGY